MNDNRQPRVLIVKLSSLGDVVHSLPTLAALRRHLPQAFIGWCVGQAAAPLVAGHPLLDITFVLREGAVREAPGVIVRQTSLALVRAIRRYRFDIALDLQGLFKSAWLACLAGARRRVGYRTWQECAFFFNERAIAPRRVHAVDNYLDFARLLGAQADKPEFVLLERPEAVARMEALLAETGAAGQAAVLLPSTSWASKRWLPERFGELAQVLAGWGLRPLVGGAPGDGALCDQVVSKAGGVALSIAGRTGVGDLPALFRRCRLVVGPDSGPTHVAAATGTPVVAIYGPTQPLLTAPYGERVEVVQAAAPCAPCRKRQCADLACQRAVTVEMVAQAARRLLGQ